VYRETAGFPKEERFGLVSQLRRAASSVPANIAEGFGRRSTKDLLRFLEIANGSLEETKYFLRLSKDLQYMNDPTIFADEIRLRRSRQVIGWAVSSASSETDVSLEALVTGHRSLVALIEWSNS
jgi:four helix bundle protein